IVARRHCKSPCVDCANIKLRTSTINRRLKWIHDNYVTQRLFPCVSEMTGDGDAVPLALLNQFTSKRAIRIGEVPDIRGQPPMDARKMVSPGIGLHGPTLTRHIESSMCRRTRYSCPDCPKPGGRLGSWGRRSEPAPRRP